MEDGAKVKLRGVQVGEVTQHRCRRPVPAGACPSCNLKIDPEPFQYLPSNVEAEIKSSTAFGAKYVDLIVPVGRQPRAGSSRVRWCAPATSPSRSTPCSRTCSGVVQSIDPAKLNSVLSAVAEVGARQGRSHRSGDHRRQQRAARRESADGDRPAGLAAVRSDRRKAYSDAAQNIVSILDSFSTTSTTITDNAQALDTLLLSAVGFSQCGDQHDRREPAEPGARDEHSRSDDAVADEVLAHLHLPVPGRSVVPGERWPRCHRRQREIGDHGRGAAVRATTRTAIPTTCRSSTRRAGPAASRAAARCPTPLKNFPVKYLVTDTGFGTGLDVRPNPGIGFPGIANYFPVTKAIPEPPRIRYPGGPAPGPLPPYPGAPAYGAPEYGPDGTPLYPPPPARRLRPRHRHHRQRGPAMRGVNGRALARVGVFTAVCLVFMFILVTVFGQFRFDEHATPTTRCSPTCRGSRAATSSVSPVWRSARSGT